MLYPKLSLTDCWGKLTFVRGTFLLSIVFGLCLEITCFNAYRFLKNTFPLREWAIILSVSCRPPNLERSGRPSDRGRGLPVYAPWGASAFKRSTSFERLNSDLGLRRGGGRRWGWWNWSIKSRGMDYGDVIMELLGWLRIKLPLSISQS